MPSLSEDVHLLTDCLTCGGKGIIRVMGRLQQCSICAGSTVDKKRKAALERVLENAQQ